MEFALGVIVGAIICLIVCGVIAMRWLDEFMRDFWN